MPETIQRLLKHLPNSTPRYTFANSDVVLLGEARASTERAKVKDTDLERESDPIREHRGSTNRARDTRGVYAASHPKGPVQAVQWQVRREAI